ncbi:checkpoint protein HUS1-like [Centruroides sculpturatus]|uniref:checkpoint protein HUS1-like n=1 Tax=Centruroides sculpturatus TaxID=218467 RepID=UPI000C6D78E1|nr:checkpoint protein HUS1-like [Centruroides sculpturatus]
MIKGIRDHNQKKGKTPLTMVMVPHGYQILIQCQERLLTQQKWVTGNHFFNEYNMIGVSDEFNEIYLELSTDNLVQALKSSSSAKTLKIKLTKKHAPCLTLENELPSLSSYSRLVIHDVPVRVIPVRFWDEFQEPEMLQFDVSLYMPPLKIVRNIIDRMKNLDSFVTLSASPEGILVLQVENDIVTVKTRFTNLEIPSGTGQNEDADPELPAEVRVNIKKLSQFLFGEQVNPLRVICNIIHNKMIHFFLLHDDVSLQFFLPCVSH